MDGATKLPLVGGRDEEPHTQTQAQPPRKKHAKLFHKKCRTGCQRCRIRRVKCDEAKPICSNCTRLDLECGYGLLSTTSNGEPDVVKASPELSADNNLVGSDGVLHLAETEARRKLELGLFYHYVTETAPTLGAEKSAQDFIGPALCRAALQSDAVLYGLCMLSALHKAYKSGFSEPEHMQHHSTYLNLTLQSHHKHVARLDIDNVDYSCMASSTLRVYSYVQLQRRELEPYTPPIEWLRMSNTSSIVFRKALALSEKNPHSLSGKLMLEVSQHLDEKRRLDHSSDLLHLLRRQEPHELEEEWDDEVNQVYRRTLSCFGWVWRHKFDSHPPPGMSQKIYLFPMIVDAQFVDYVAQRRPRALVILAHYFTLLALHRDFWYIGDAGFREVGAIAAAVPLEWRGMLIQPLEILKNPSLLCQISRNRY